MILKDISFRRPEDNIVFDEVLFRLAEEGRSGEMLRFWESPVPFIVLGRIGREQEDIDLALAREKGVSILRRSSGGGTVIQGPGCLNFCLILAKEQHPGIDDLRKSYRLILEQVVEVFRRLGTEVFFRPICDLAFGEAEKKFSGNAQRRGRNFILHHGTILYDFDLALIEKLLKVPRDIPEYRQGRPHRDFVTNIPVQLSALKTAFKDVFRVTKVYEDVSPEERVLLERLQTEYQQGLSSKPLTLQN